MVDFIENQAKNKADKKMGHEEGHIWQDIQLLEYNRMFSNLVLITETW